MKKNRKLFVVSLAFLILAAPVVFVKAVDVNENQANINKNQERINEKQERLNEKQAKINDVNENENKKNQANVNGANHRSAVATFVQNLLSLADREKGGIGEQVKTIAQQQNDSKDNVADRIDKVGDRSEFKTFLIGTDFKNIGELRSEMVTTGNQIDELKTLLDKTTDVTNKATLQSQIDALTLEQQKINDFIKTNESKISLLGWLVKLFN